jgi:hypothetical protein
MENTQKLATVGTQDTGWRQTKIIKHSVYTEIVTDTTTQN